MRQWLEQPRLRTRLILLCFAIDVLLTLVVIVSEQPEVFVNSPHAIELTQAELSKPLTDEVPQPQQLTNMRWRAVTLPSE